MSTGLEEIDQILDPEIDIPPEIEPELSDILPRGYLSPSQMSTFLKCPKQWALIYVDKKPRRTSARMFQGIFVHEAMEAVLKERLRTGNLPSLEMAQDTFSTAFDDGKKHIEDWEGEPEGSVKDIGIKCTEAFYEEAAPGSTPIAVEQTFHVVIKRDNKIHLPILGKIDSEQIQAHTEQEYQDIRQAMLGGDKTASQRKPLRIHDLKVVTDKWSQGDIDNDFQFSIYAGVRGIPDIQVDQIVKGRAKVPRVRYEKLTGVVTAGRVEHAFDVAAGVAQSIALGHFPPTNPENWWCSDKWCSMWQHCRGKKGG